MVAQRPEGVALTAYFGLIALFFAVAMAIAIERIAALRADASLETTAFLAQVQKLVLQADIDRARALCETEPRRAVARVVEAALAHAGGPREEIDSAVEETSAAVGHELSRRTSLLPMLANVATLSGLLGTVAGLMASFDAVADATADARQALLSDGVAAALVPTWAGLLAAVPILVAHGMIHDRTADAFDAIERARLRSVRLLSVQRQPRTPLAPPRARDLW